MKEVTRRKFLKAGLIGSVAGGAGLAGADSGSKPREPTPPEVEGPFYPIVAQKDKDFDLTQIEGRAHAATGTVIWVEGQILGTDGKPVIDASVELWQANAAGRYNHPHDTNTAPVDPNFQGWAIVASGKDGKFRFKTIMPGIYPAGRHWDRPPHIHFKVTKRGYVELITQMYFPGHALNDKDLLLKRKTVAEQKAMIATKVKKAPETYRHQMIIEKV